MPEPSARTEDTVTLDTSPTMAMTTLYGAAIGPIASDYYLPIFERFEAAGRGTLSWNGSACLYNLNWLLFRGLWGMALAFAGTLMGMALVLVALGLLVFDWSPLALTVVLLTGLVLACVMLGVWGNALLYNHSRAAMMAAVANNKTLVQACNELGQRASSRTRFLRILAVNAALLALIGAIAALMMPSSDNQADNPTPQASSAVADPTPPASAAAPSASTAEPTARAIEPVVSAAPAASAAETPASVPAPAASSVAPMASAPSVLTHAAPTAPTAPTVPASAAEQAVSAPAPATAVSAPKSAVAASRESKAPQRATATKNHARTSATESPQEFYVNAGLFADPDNARRTLTRLTQVGLPATTQELSTSNGTRTRVRVGPFPNRHRAELAVRHIKAMDLDAVLVKP